MTFFKHNPCIQKDERRCTNCIHAHKVPDEYDRVYECDAVEYDIEHLTCFVPKEETKDGKS